MDVGKKVFIDTAPFIYLIENHPVFGAPTEKYLLACAEDESKLLTSVIRISEMIASVCLIREMETINAEVAASRFRLC